MTSTLSGQTALVTGGAKRLGRAVCEALAGCGVRIAVHYNRSADEADALVERLRGQGIEAQAFAAELGTHAQRKALVDEVVRAFGSLDILVNSASIFPEDRLADVSIESLVPNIEVNALAPLELSRAFAAQDRPGCIVNFLDTRVLDYDEKHVSYHLSKRMLFSLTRMMATEFAPAVRVNGVAPGLVLPPAGKDESYLESLKHTNPLNTYGSEADIARAVLFLAESPFITGQVIYVDGGRHMKSHFYGS